MELLSPSAPPRQSEDPFIGVSLPGSFPTGLGRRSRTVTSRLPESVEGDGGKVHVAVGKSVGKAVALLQWCLRTFVNSEICILHVHQPSSFIPTLLGKLPASQANPDVVSGYRMEEREETRKLLRNYLNICSKAKVKASIIAAEAHQVPAEIVNLIDRHDITRLVIGAVPDCTKFKKCSSKASYTAKMAPSFCEIWFVNKGTLVWKRQTSDISSSFKPIIEEQPVTTSNIRSRTLQSCKNDCISYSDCFTSSSTQLIVNSSKRNYSQTGATGNREPSPNLPSTSNPRTFHLSTPASFGLSSGYTSSAEQRASSDSGTNIEEDCLYEQLSEVKKGAENSRDEAMAELLLCRKLEVEAFEANRQVQAFESACASEIELRKEAEDELRTIIEEQEKLLQEREEITRELHKAMRNIAVLDSRAQEANRRCEVVAGEIKLICSTAATSRQEKQKLRQQKMEAKQRLDNWKSHRQTNYTNIKNCLSFNRHLNQLAEFSLPDLQAATCNFSESFKIGQGGYGAVYKGEMLERTVAIKKLHPYNTQGQPEFYQEIQILGRLHHKHLVGLIGVCPEAWSLVYDYVLGGSLQDRLFCRSNVCPLDWKTRAQVIAEIASGLWCLHTSHPEKIVHGDLKPNNVLLDSDNSSKICDFGIYRLVPRQTLRCPSFRRYTETKGAFPYADPEFHRTGILTTKSDIFSFGLIILQLLTGKDITGLVCEVRKAVSCGKLVSILDSSAGEWSMFVARRLMELGLQCCELNSRDRPELTPNLVRELEQLHVVEDRSAPLLFLCPILREIMHDPQVAADGFTYEGDAIRGWLENGRESSPMTNLKLNHLTLTPNRALQVAIKDWVCKS